MSVSSTRYGIVIGLAAGAVMLTGCGGGGGKSNADPSSSAAPTGGSSPGASDGASPGPSDSGQPGTAPSGGAAAYTGPTVGPGTSCGTVTVVIGHIQCSHAEKIFELYGQSKKPDGKAVFNGWSCLKATNGVVCSRSGIKLRSAA